jgi:hypothetical protein
VQRLLTLCSLFIIRDYDVQAFVIYGSVGLQLLVSQHYYTRVGVFLTCGCFGNTCTRIYCAFVLFRLCIFMIFYAFV